MTNNILHKMPSGIIIAATALVIVPNNVSAKELKVNYTSETNMPQTVQSNKDNNGSTEPQDSTSINQIMTLEREFAPIVRDANKLDKQPEIEAPSISKTNASYASWQANTSKASGFSKLPVGQVFDSEPFSTKRGYADFNIGNYLNINADAGYRIIDTENTILKAQASFHGSYAKYGMNVKTANNITLPDWRNNNTLAGGCIDVSRMLDFYTWGIDAHYYQRNYSLLNYNLLNSDDYTISLPKQKQKIGNFDVSLHFGNMDNEEMSSTLFNVAAGVSLLNAEYPDVSELTVHVGGEVMSEFDDNSVGLKANVSVINYNYGNNSQLTASSSILGKLENGTEVSLTPFLNLELENWKLQLGARADLITGPDNHFGIAPDVHITYDFDKRSELFLDVVGGLKRATLLQMQNNIPYYIALYQPKNEWTMFDGTLGFRNYSSGNFNGEVFIGSKYTVDALTPMSAYNSSYGTILTLVNFNDFSFKAGFKTKYTYNKYFAIGVDATVFAHSKEKAASYKPAFEANMHIYSRPISPLLIDVFYNGQFDRKAWGFMNGATSKLNLDNINNLGIKGNWSFNSNFSVYAEANNIFCQKHDIWYGVPAQRLNVHIGGTIQF